MQERARYRVTGALFLLALLVIFVPMLFDGEGSPVSDLPRPSTTISSAPDDQRRFDDIVPTTDVVERIETLHNEIDAEGFSKIDGTRFGEPRLMPIQDASEVLAVQAGSFAQLKNALSFRDTVRGLGYEAFISSSKDDAGRIRHRVAVGPLLDKADARAIADALNSKLEVDARIMELQI
ncbi:MAG: SPOR domain-containing protein [Pseudomonadota bacterium]